MPTLSLSLRLSHRHHHHHLSSPLHSLFSPSSFLFSFRPKRFHFLKPCSSLKQTKKQLQKTSSGSNAPQSLRWFLNPKSSDGEEDASGGGNGDDGGLESGDTAVKGTLLAGLLLVGVVGGFATVGYVYRDQINAFLTQFRASLKAETQWKKRITYDIIEHLAPGYGPAGYALFVAVYAGLEILAIPAIPLTMSAGLLFGSFTGTIIVSISGTVAASVAFLIARYFARERILKLVEGNKKFLAIDKAIGENGFRVVTLLRLSPLLPFSLGNYLYGLTSVKFVPYVLGSWLGMLPGTWAYVSAGAFGRAIIVSLSLAYPATAYHTLITFNFLLLTKQIKILMTFYFKSIKGGRGAEDTPARYMIHNLFSANLSMP
ncbi:TVP38/TMEM64 family membrane protein slr0305 [Vitis vinifera]|uniref:TVP38/TMEM64 family membrane protein slr0305 n=1 Tax=Vitis vinifera TaxID=29760 RepID=A0A438D7W3_VITVI|nr:TVP38/TMEM64 family membrane protein slr0305 [Vitis vinifera]